MKHSTSFFNIINKYSTLLQNLVLVCIFSRESKEVESFIIWYKWCTCIGKNKIVTTNKIMACLKTSNLFEILKLGQFHVLGTKFFRNWIWANSMFGELNFFGIGFGPIPTFSKHKPNHMNLKCNPKSYHLKSNKMLLSSLLPCPLFLCWFLLFVVRLCNTS